MLPLRAAAVTDRASLGSAGRRRARYALAVLVAAAAGAGCAHRGKPVVLDRPAGIIVEQRRAGPAWRFDEVAVRGEDESFGGGRRRGAAPALRSFSEAVAAFDFDEALKFAVVRRLRGDPAGGEAEQRLIDALRLAVTGSDAADSALAETIRATDDTLVRRVARLALTATLQYHGRWATLAELPPVEGSRADSAAAAYAASGAATSHARSSNSSSGGAAAAKTRPAIARLADTTVTSMAGVTPFAAGDSGRTGYVSAVMDDPAAKASVESWARAYRGAPAARYVFPNRPVVLPLSLSPTGAPVVPVIVNGRQFLFWLDTGSSLTILSSEVAATAGAAAYGADTLEIVTATGRVAARPAVVSSLALGGVVVRDLPAMIVDGDALSLPSRDGTVPTRVDGIVGFDVIRRMDLELDYAASRATIREPAAPDPRHPTPRNLFWLGYPVVRLVASDGRPVHFALDTGADETYAALPLVWKTRVRTVAAERRRVSGFGNTLTVRGQVIPQLRLMLRETALRFERVFVYVVDYPTLFTLDGTLGGDVGAGGVVRIDMTNGVFAVGGER